jgi:hypothetical protein
MGFIRFLIRLIRVKYKIIDIFSTIVYNYLIISILRSNRN